MAFTVIMPSFTVSTALLSIPSAPSPEVVISNVPLLIVMFSSAFIPFADEE